MAVRSTYANPAPEPAGGCYHVWVIANSGNAIHRRERCYTRAGANAAIRRWSTYGDGGGDRPRNLLAGKEAIKAQTLVLACRPGCPCTHAGQHPTRKEARNA